MDVEMELLYRQHKPLLFSLAYRMLGSVMEAEDIVHDTIIAFEKVRVLNKIANSRAYLCRTVTNLCLNRLHSARHLRETYSGQWLPEPIETGGIYYDPAESWQQKETLSTAYLLLLNRLTYSERAVFILRECFDYEYEEIAEVVDKTAANCRKIYSRAKTKMTNAEGMPSYEMTAKDQSTSNAGRLNSAKRFIEALKTGEIAAALQLLSDQAVLIADGGGKVNTAPKPIAGAANIVYFLYAVAANTEALNDLRYAEINGYPGLIVDGTDGPTHVVSFRYNHDKIQGIYVMANPMKLRHFAQDTGRAR